MRKTITALLLGALMVCVGGYATSVQAGMTKAGKKAMSEAGRVMFENRCRSCHTDDAAKASYGPSLVGVIGRKAGSLPGFEYSDALKNSSLVWSEPLLRAWITDNDALIPGTRMRHVSITDKTEQDFLLSFIKELSAKGD